MMKMYRMYRPLHWVPARAVGRKVKMAGIGFLVIEEDENKIRGK